MTKTYLDKRMENTEFRQKFNNEYDRLCEELEGTPEEKNEAELEIMGKWYYRNV